MEMANHWTRPNLLATTVRVAEPNDKPDIMYLLQHSRYQHLHLDWQPPADWVGKRGFVVLPRTESAKQTLTNRLFAAPSRLAACLAAVADPAPAAWVRIACLGEVPAPKEVLAALMEEVVTGLLSTAVPETAVSELGWLAVEPWPNQWLPALGFNIANEIETYVKTGLEIPNVPISEQLTIRPAQLADMVALAEIEKQAFAPLWRHSASGLGMAFQQAFSFDVAEWNGRIVGFQFSTRNHNSAHLARMTVSPAAQRCGVGSTLLTHILKTCREYNLHYISLNTQIDNKTSQKLYTKFGFHPRGQRLPVWVRQIG